MELHKRVDYSYVHHGEMIKGATYERATLSDLKAALAEHGYKAIQHIDTDPSLRRLEEPECEAIHKALLRASKEVVPSVDQLRKWLAEHGMVAVPGSFDRFVEALGPHIDSPNSLKMLALIVIHRAMIKVAAEADQ